jgi:calcineurin-like phosphoesterase
MRIVFIGDIYGRSGREALETHLPKIKAELKPDVIIVNADNAANGRGVTEKQVKEFYELGVNCITGGDHVWDQRAIIPYIGRDPALLRPINYPADTTGKGHFLFRTAEGQTCLIIHALGRVFIDPLDDPFSAVKKIVDLNPQRRCHLRRFSRRSHIGKNGHGALSGRQGQRRRRYAHPYPHRG